MNEQNFVERVNTSDSVEQTDQDTNSSVEISDYFDEDAPVDATLHPEALIDGVIVDVGPIDETVSDQAPIDTNIGSLAALLDLEVSEHLRTRWNEIQGKFVDEPRSSVQQADALVSEVVEKITEMFSSEHSSLEGQWKEGKDVSTEDLRKALQHYRSFFNRMVV
jgi:hypothetical protein